MKRSKITLLVCVVLLISSAALAVTLKTNDLPYPVCGMPGQPDCPACACDSLSGWDFIKCLILNGCRVPSAKKPASL